jgi:hypothetical protein
MANVVPEAPPPANRGLWMLVIGLGIAIVVVVALMIGIAIKRAFDKPTEATVATLKPGEVPELNLDLAPGMSVVETRIEAGLLIVRVTGATAEEILVIDPAKSKVLSRVRFNKKVP